MSTASSRRRTTSRRPLRGLVVAVALLASTTVTLALPGAPASAASTAGDAYVLKSARALDTRTGLGAPKAALTAGKTISVQVTGRAGVPTSGAASVIANVTAYTPTRSGSLTVWPAGSARPALPTVQFGAGESIAVAVPVKLGTGGKLSVYSSASSVHAALDVQAWHTTGATSTAGSRYAPLQPVRVLDTRSGLGAPKAKLGAGTTATLLLTGKAGIPATGARAAALSFTGLTATVATSLTVWPAGATRPATPNIHLKPGLTRTAVVSVPLGAGKVSIHNAAGTVHVLADVAGWYGAAGAVASSRYVPRASVRLLDTATGLGAPRAALGAGRTLTLQVSGRGGLPAGGVSAAPLLVTASAATVSTALTVWPAGTTRPATPNLYLPVGRRIAAPVLARLGTGRVSIHNSAGTVQLTAETAGWLEAPAPVRPVVPPAPTSIVDVAAALYTGSNPVQTGVARGAIDPAHVSVVRGSVQRRGGSALAGVRVTVLDAPELGATSSQADGSFAMAVNGGGELTFTMTKAGFLTTQRDAAPAWLEYATLPQVEVIALDPAATNVPLTTTSTSDTLVKGSTVTDENGTRQAALLFQAGTTATMTLPDGSTRPLSSGTVRATEFTVGTDGREAMPGELPSSSGYTYASEFTLDQAQAAGATRVDFTKPVVSYTDNFLGFPSGTPVPAGYFDRELGTWVGSRDGRVIDIVSEANGLADVDVDGDGVADTGFALASLDIDTAERVRLADAYAPGKSLWRVQITHFTPWDYNWPYGPPPGATGPGGRPYDPNAPDDECQQSGSVISCESQTLGETIGVTGTPYALGYSSSRVPGNRSTSTLEVPVSGSTVPSSLDGVKVTLSVAGKEIVQDFGAAPGQKTSLTWDGRDAKGNPVQGSQRASVSIGYAYTPFYYAPSSSSSGTCCSAFAASFARFGTDVLTTRGGSPITGSQAIYLSKSFPVTLGSYDARGAGLGGWTLDVHHTYDPSTRVLYLGDGTKRSSSGMQPVLDTAAGQGSSGYYGDGGKATEAGLDGPGGVAVDKDGVTYVADTGNDVVRRIAADGTITTLVGGGAPADGIGDGGPASDARLIGPRDVALAADGSLYIADTGNARVRRLSPTGVLSTVAGGGSPEDGLGDGLLATEASLDAPQGLTFGPDGTLYVADSGNGRVRAVTPDGTIATIAGGGSPLDGLGDGLEGRLASLVNPADVAVLDGTVLVSDTGHNRVRQVGVDGRITTFAGNGSTAAVKDGLPAANSPLARPGGLAVDLDGVVYVTDRGHHVVREIRQDGVLNTAAGNGTGGATGDGGAPLEGQLSFPQGVGTRPDGGLVIADTGGHRIRTVKPALPGLGSSTIVVVAEDGSELYAFDSKGKHLATRDGLTGATLLTFGYDTAGRLAFVADETGSRTLVERDSSGAATAVTAPTGQRTSLTVDANGYLSSVVDPAGARVSLGYGTEGLLTRLTDARGGFHAYGYDGVGRLVSDTDASGSTQTLKRTATDRGYVVDVVTAAGRASRFEVENLPDGGTRRTQKPYNLGPTIVTTNADGTVTTRVPNGTSITETVSPDPRWGQQAPYPSASTIRQSNGRTSTSKTLRTAVLANPADPLSVVSTRSESTYDGRTTISEWTAATRTLTTTSAAGRTVVTVLDALGRTVSDRYGTTAPTRYTYDTAGRPTGTSSGVSDIRTTATTYDALGRTSRSTDALGRSTTLTYDGADRVTAVTSSDGSVVRQAYDAGGNAISTTPPGSAPHAFTLDGASSATAYTPPALAGVATRVLATYDADHFLKSTVLPDGKTVTRSFDGTGRLNGVSDGSTTHSYGYDVAGRTVTRSSSPSNAVTTTTYDGELVSRTTSSGPAAGTIDYAYGADSRLLSRTVSGGTPVTYEWDADDQPSRVGGLTITRSADGRPTTTGLGAATTTTTYDEHGDIAGLSTTAAAGEAFGVTMTRDKNGRALTRTERTAGVSTPIVYTYDTAERLASERRNGVLTTFGYSANGNRTSVATGGSVRTATFDAQDRLLDDGTWTYTWTAVGALAAKTEKATGQRWTYDYDGLGNLRRVVKPGGTTIDYQVDAENRRIGKKVDGVLVRGWLYEAEGVLPVAELNGDGAVVSRFSWASGDGAPAFMTRGSQTLRFVNDENEGARALVDTATGAVVQRLTYDAFGRVLEDTAPGLQPFGFAGGLYDADTGLVRFGARDYDAFSGRWTSKDPLGVSSSLNLYAYVENDPVNTVDPLGLIGWPSRQGIADFSAGIGDGMSFGLTKKIRDNWGPSKGTVNECSPAYAGGKVIGENLPTPVGGPLKVARGAGTGIKAVKSGAAAAKKVAKSPKVKDFARRTYDELLDNPGSPVPWQVTTPLQVLRDARQYGLSFKDYWRRSGSQTRESASSLARGAAAHGRDLMAATAALPGFNPRYY